jgi:hypothetical protein
MFNLIVQNAHGRCSLRTATHGPGGERISVPPSCSRRELLRMDVSCLACRPTNAYPGRRTMGRHPVHRRRRRRPPIATTVVRGQSAGSAVWRDAQRAGPCCGWATGPRIMLRHLRKSGKGVRHDGSQGCGLPSRMPSERWQASPAFRRADFDTDQAMLKTRFAPTSSATGRGMSGGTRRNLPPDLRGRWPEQAEVSPLPIIGLRQIVAW